MGYLPVEVELEPPHSVVLGAGVVPVVYEVAERGAAEAFEGQAFGVEGFLLRSWHQYIVYVSETVMLTAE